MDNNNGSFTMIWNSSRNGTIIFNPPEVPLWGFWVKHVATPVVTAVGLTGNSLSFLVMCYSQRLRKQSYSQLLCVLAVFDSLNLIINQVELADEMVVYKSGHQFSFYTDLPNSVCKIYNFLKHVFLLGSSWLIVCLSIERVQAVCFPFKRTFLRRRFSVAILVTITMAILSLTQIFRILFIENVRGYCMAVEEYLSLYVHLHQYGYHLSLLFALPCVIVLSCNFAVIYQIYVIKKEAGNDCPPSLGSTRKTTTMLLLIGFVFIITMFPQFLCTSVLLYYTDESRRHIGQHKLLKMRPYLELFSVVSYTNYCINFGIYVLCGRSFRWELCRMIKCNRRRNIFREEQTKRTEEVTPLQG